MAKTPSKKSAKAPKKAGGKGSKKKRTESYRLLIAHVRAADSESPAQRSQTIPCDDRTMNSLLAHPHLQLVYLQVAQTGAP